MGEENDQKTIKQDIIDKNRKRYLKKSDSEMTEDEKKDEEAMRDLNNGPTSDANRSCQDIFCCLFFLAFIGGCIVVTIFGFSRGDPSALMYIYDEAGNPCGKSSGVAADYPYLYLYNAVENVASTNLTYLKQGICVKSCPKTYNSTTLECIPTANNKDCSVKKINIYLSTPFLQKLCFPSKDLYDQAKLDAAKSTDSSGRTAAEMDSQYTAMGGLINANFINVDKLFDYLGDFGRVWPICIACAGIALVVGFLYLLIIRCCGACIAYISILLVEAALLALGFLFWKRMDLYTSVDDVTYRNIMLGFAITFWALSLIWFLIIICSCNKIRLAIALTEVAAIFVWKVMSIVLVPFFFFLIVALYLAYWVALSIFIYSAGDVTKGSNTFIATVTWDKTTRYAWWFNLFALLYTTAFIEALASFIYSSTACIWYFEQGGTDKDVPRPVCRSFWRAFRYHLGSLAFGSLIIAIVRFIMVIVAYIRYQLEHGGGPKNAASRCYKCLLDSLLCMLGCVEKCMEFINRHAYIQIALRGKSFCTSAFDGFAIVIRNLGRWTILTMIGGIFNSIGKLFIAGVTGVAGYVIITEVTKYSEKLNSPLLPTLVFILTGYVIGSIFISIYGNACDALMHCFLVDCEINRDAKHSPEQLRKFVEDEKDN